MANISVLKVKGVTYQIKDSIARQTKQDLLVSGTNIKTINGQSILGSGNIIIDATNRVPKRLSNLDTLPNNVERSTAYIYVDNNGEDTKLPLSSFATTLGNINTAEEKDIIELFRISS